MRKLPIAAIVTFAVVLFAGAQLAVAQEIETSKVAVAFPFMVGKVLLPAGTYEIIPDDLAPGSLEIRADRGRVSAFATVLAEDTTARRGDCQFQFVNVGGRYYLTKIDDGTGDVSEIALPEAVMRLVHASARNVVAQK